MRTFQVFFVNIFRAVFLPISFLSKKVQSSSEIGTWYACACGWESGRGFRSLGLKVVVAGVLGFVEVGVVVGGAGAGAEAEDGDGGGVGDFGFSKWTCFGGETLIFWSRGKVWKVVCFRCHDKWFEITFFLDGPQTIENCEFKMASLKLTILQWVSGT